LASVFLKRTPIVLYPRLAWFYLWIGVAGLLWAFIGLIHSATYIQGVFDSLRLYVVWSAAFVILYTILRAGASLSAFHTAIVLAGILIPVINLVGLYDQFNGGGIISDAMRKELDLEVGFL